MSSDLLFFCHVERPKGVETSLAQEAQRYIFPSKRTANIIYYVHLCNPSVKFGKIFFLCRKVTTVRKNILIMSDVAGKFTEPVDSGAKVRYLYLSRKIHFDMKQFLLLPVLVLMAATLQISYAQERFEIFTTGSETDIPYRIPAVAALPDGTVICVADYRYSRRDIGMAENGRVDLHVRVSEDNGCSWGDVAALVEGKGSESPDFMNVAFGDPCIVADRKSGRVLVMSCSGNISFPKGRRDRHLGIVRFYSDDGGKTWTAPEEISESIYSQFDAVNPIQSMFIASGRIMQSRYICKGEYYRLYCAILAQIQGKVWHNYVLYSDDFGQSWNILGGADTSPIPDGGNEAKVEELPGGSVLISSRTKPGGRLFNIYDYKDKRRATGSWGKVSHSSTHNNGIITEKNDCNGEVMVLPVVRTEDGRKMDLLLQSAPMGPGRANVGIYYKALESRKDYSSPESIAEDWEGVFKITDKGSAYSTMDLQSDGSLGFLFEEETYCTTKGGGYTIVYDNLSVDEITAGRYKIDQSVKHP